MMRATFGFVDIINGLTHRAYLCAYELWLTCGRSSIGLPVLVGDLGPIRKEQTRAAEQSQCL
jgi:hypothetical protein